MAVANPFFLKIEGEKRILYFSLTYGAGPNKYMAKQSNGDHKMNI